MWSTSTSTIPLRHLSTFERIPSGPLVCTLVRVFRATSLQSTQAMGRAMVKLAAKHLCVPIIYEAA